MKSSFRYQNRGVKQTQMTWRGILNINVRGRNSPHHFDTLSSAQPLIDFPLGQGVSGALPLGLSLLRVVERLLAGLGLLRLLLLPLFLQLELKILQVAVGSLVCWVWRRWRHYWHYCELQDTQTPFQPFRKYTYIHITQHAIQHTHTVLPYNVLNMRQPIQLIQVIVFLILEEYIICKEHDLWLTHLLNMTGKQPNCSGVLLFFHWPSMDM